MPASRKKRARSHHTSGAEGDDLAVRKVIGKELTEAEELSARLSALLELGAVVAAVEPMQRALEDRVRDALEST